MPRKNKKQFRKNKPKRNFRGVSSQKPKAKNHKRTWRKKVKVFETGAYICIRKQREGVGRVQRSGKGRSYLIHFKNGKRSFYNSPAINRISEEEYNAASADFVIDPTLPSPSPSPAPSMASMATMSPSLSPTPFPDPATFVDDDLEAPQNIRFTAGDNPEGKELENDVAEADSADQRMRIRIDAGNDDEAETLEVNETQAPQPEPEAAHKDEDAAAAITIGALESDDRAQDEPPSDDKSEEHREEQKADDVVQEVSSKHIDVIKAPSSDVEIDEEPGQIESKCDTALDVPAVEYEQVEGVAECAVELPTPEHDTVVAADDGEHAEDTKEPEPEPKAEMLPIFKRPKDTMGAKYAKKLKKLYRVSDKRERAFLLMCDESKMVDLQSMRDYLAHFGEKVGVKVRKRTARGFFESMNPNARSLVSFSKFVKAVDENGDVIAAYKRFRASRTSRPRKN